MALDLKCTELGVLSASQQSGFGILNTVLGEKQEALHSLVSFFFPPY